MVERHVDRIVVIVAGSADIAVQPRHVRQRGHGNELRAVGMGAKRVEDSRVEGFISGLPVATPEFEVPGRIEDPRSRHRIGFVDFGRDDIHVMSPVSQRQDMQPDHGNARMRNRARRAYLVQIAGKIDGVSRARHEALLVFAIVAHVAYDAVRADGVAHMGTLTFQTRWRGPPQFVLQHPLEQLWHPARCLSARVIPSSLSPAVA